MEKKQDTVYFNKGGWGSKFEKRWLVINANGNSREVQVYSDKASYFTKGKAIIDKSTIKQCGENKSSHDSKAFGFFIKTKKKKYEFSVNKKQQRDEWINFGVLYMSQISYSWLLFYGLIYKLLIINI